MTADRIAELEATLELVKAGLESEIAAREQTSRELPEEPSKDLPFGEYAYEKAIWIDKLRDYAVAMKVAEQEARGRIAELMVNLVTAQNQCHYLAGTVEILSKDKERAEKAEAALASCQQIVNAQKAVVVAAEFRSTVAGAKLATARQECSELILHGRKRGIDVAMNLADFTPSTSESKLPPVPSRCPTCGSQESEPSPCSNTWHYIVTSSKTETEQIRPLRLGNHAIELERELSAYRNAEMPDGEIECPECDGAIGNLGCSTCVRMWIEALAKRCARLAAELKSAQKRLQHVYDNRSATGMTLVAPLLYSSYEEWVAGLDTALAAGKEKA